MSPVRAVVFDLYGTLVERGRALFEREFPRRHGIDRRRWIELVRRVLLVERFAGREEFVARVTEDLLPAAGPELVAEALELLGEELSGVEALPGVRQTIRFLKRRGLRLGLLSNLASPYREPFFRLGLAEEFDAVGFSCDEGRTKPSPALYHDLCARLGVPPEETLMVGDSAANDVLGARAAGLRGLLASEGGWAAGWLDFAGCGEPLLAPGARLDLDGEEVELSRFEPLADDEAGRYNLVARGTVVDRTGSRRALYFKRYLHPGTAHGEAFVHELLPELALSACRVGLLPLSEPVLWSEAAPGEKLGAYEVDPQLAFEIGRHGGSAFVLANADLRPRNGFLAAEDGRRRIVMIDYEHCLFDRALDLEGLADPFDGDALDALGTAEIERRTARRVLTRGTMRRTRRAFLATDGAPAEVVAAFREGWIELHSRAQARRQALSDRLRERLSRRPGLEIGTQAYRRAMARFDLDDLLARIDLDPAATCDESL